MRKILVLRGGALGDFIVTLPALDLLRRQWPDAEIHLVGNAAAATLALTRDLVSKVHSQHEARWSALYGDAPLPSPLATWLAGFDLVLNFWPDPDGELQRRFPLGPAQRFLSAPALPAQAPAAAHYCAPLAALGLRPERLFVPLRPTVDVPAPTPAAILVHPGSGSPRKNWPRERWLAVLTKLPRPVTVVLGEAEMTSWPAVLPPDVSQLRNAPLETLVAHLARCRLFLGHDSGISHLAAACGAPCLLLFGPTDPAMWAPPAPRVQVIRHEADLNSIPLAAVQQALTTVLAGAR